MWCDITFVIVLLAIVIRSSLAMSVYSGSAVNFTCTLDPIIIWEYERAQNHSIIGVDMTKTGILANDDRYSIIKYNGTTTLMLAGATLADQGLFKCSQFVEGGGSEQWNLEVYVLPEHPVIYQNNTADEGELYVVECTAEGGRPAAIIRWSFVASNGDAIYLSNADKDTNYLKQYINGTITITAYSKIGVVLTRQMQGGRFVCNSYQSDLEEYYNETTSQVLANGMFAPLTPEIIGANVSLIENQRHLVTCSADYANPPANISWTILTTSGDEERLDADTVTSVYRDGYYRTQSKIYVTAKREYSYAALKCVATNDVVSRKNLDEPVASTELNINYRPVMVIGGIRVGTNKTINVSEGDNLTIPCQVVDSKPAATAVNWQQDVTFVNINQNQRYGVSGSLPTISLNINGVIRSDRGAWRCRGTNAIGFGFSNIYRVNVFYKPICKPDQKLKFAAAINSRVELVCSVIANPTDVNFLWRKSGATVQPRTPGRTSAIEEDTAYSTYSVVPRRQSDYGEYECYSDNSGGNMDSPCVIELHLPGPAEAPAHCLISNITLTSFVVICVPSFDGGSLATYTLKLLADGQYVTKFNQTMPTFNVTGLRENSSYTFTVCASNAEYWADQDCTQRFTGTTASLYVLGEEEKVTPAKSSSSPLLTTTELYIVVSVTSATVIALVLALAIFCYKRTVNKSAGSTLQERLDINSTRRTTSQQEYKNSTYKVTHQDNSEIQQGETTPNVPTPPAKPKRYQSPHNTNTRPSLAERRHTKPSVGTDDGTHSDLMEEVKESIRSGKIKTSEEDNIVDADKMPMSLV